MNKNELIQIIKSSLKDLTTYDSLLFLNLVREEAVNHRFAVYFEKYYKIKFQKCIYHFDLEYNKNYFQTKEIIDENDERIAFRPDFIVHQRLSNENNLVAFEMKKEEPNAKDIRTIKGILKNPFKYSFGITLSYYPNGENFVYDIYFMENKTIKIEHYEENKEDLFHKAIII